MEQHVTTHASLMTAPDLEAYLVDSGMNILAAVLILGIGWWLSKRLSRWTRSALDRVHHFDETLKPLISSLVRYAVLAAAVIAVLERFGVETTSLITLLGAAGLAIGLALQGTLSNVASGVMLLVLRPFKIGDWITVSTVNQSGSVREIGLFTTIIISADQSYVSLPNSTIFSSPILNSSREPLSRLNFTIGVDTSSDTDAALQIIADVLNTDPRILKVPPPATAIAALKEYTVELLVRCWVHNADGEAVTFDLQKAIRDRFRHAGIAMPARRQISASAQQSVSANEDSPQKSAMRKSG
jgi:small conductance mechanosensitive channel